MAASKPPERSVILVDKAKGPTSLSVVEKVSAIAGVGKAGHAGTLDPNATGLLVIALGEARKAMPLMAGLDKEYVGTIRLHGDICGRKVRSVLGSFSGRIRQVPPVRSAVARKERERTVHDIEVTRISKRDVTFRVLCEAGTYIRKIAHDAGREMGCGAHLAELRRTRVGPFSVEDAVTVEVLKRMTGRMLDTMLLPLESAIERIGVPVLVMRDEYEGVVRNGSPVRKEFVKHVHGKPKKGGYVTVFNEAREAVCLGVYVGMRGTAARTDRVFLR